MYGLMHQLDIFPLLNNFFKEISIKNGGKKVKIMM
jgi:hypothetical protein